MLAQLNTYDMNRVPLWDVAPLSTPFQLCIEPTFICNFRCNYCMHALSRATLEQRGFNFAPMSEKTFDLCLVQLQSFPENIKKVCFTGFGEPLLNKRLPDMILRTMQTKKVDKTLIITNGSLLTPEMSDSLLNAGLSEIKISLQGLTAKKYKDICNYNMNFEILYDNIKYFSKRRENCKLRVKIADVSLGEGEEALFYDMFGELCDFIAIEHIYPQFNGVIPEMLHDDGKNRFGFPMQQKKVCSTLFFKLNVLQDGRITFGYPDGITYEDFNVQNMTLLDAWNSPERRRLLYDNLVGDKMSRECCSKCLRWTYSTTPDDDIDGHEDEILSRINIADYDVPRDVLRNEKILCYDGT